LISRPPVFTNRCCTRVSDHCSILFGSTKRRHRFPRLSAITLSHQTSSELILLANSEASKFLFAFHFFEGAEAWKKLGGNLGSIAVK
jgi:hypothetical protein